MPKTEAQRRSCRKWDKENYTTLSCKVRKDRALAFKAACYENGTSPSTIYSAAMDTFVTAHGGWSYWVGKTTMDGSEPE